MAKGVMLVAEDRKSEIKQHKMAWASLALLGIHQDQLDGGMVQFMMESEKFWHAYRRKDTESICFYSFTVAGSTNKTCYNGNRSEKN